MQSEIIYFSIDQHSNAEIAKERLNLILSKVDKVIALSQCVDSLNNVIITIIFEPHVNTTSKSN